MTGDAEFADEESIEWRVECRGHLGGDRNAATRQSEHNDVGSVLVVAQARRELLASVGAIAEWDRHRTLRDSAAAVNDADARTAWRRDCIWQKATQIWGQRGAKG